MTTACVPPFSRGVGGWCGCNCKCCPPPCCSVITVKFECGTPFNQWGGPDPDLGCTCATQTPLLARNVPKPIEMPTFSFEPIISEDEQFVFALGGGSSVPGSCTVPCSTITLTLTTTGCCLELTSDNNVYTVGAGTVTATLSTQGGCTPLTPLVNGTPNSVYLSDGVLVTADIQVGTAPPANCCLCCQVSQYKCATPFNMAMSQILYRQRAIRRGLRAMKSPTEKSVKDRTGKITQSKPTF
jgi:hypothetical protein